ncbi:MAG TPA: CDP-diacylglycerol--serine O-phosphatidyltransferase [Burkholderiales bacterium]|nr:CDP-diacylglycerol--serine O-phosphatidyltransferase [Burkholderiales bacterium]
MNYPEPRSKWLLKTGLARPGIYWLPNAITTCALFSGFYAIVQAMNLRFELAAMGIFVAMVFDGLDGRVARLTRTQSAFGAEYDSLSDMVAFGAAPALVIYEWALKGMGRLGWFAAFVYCAGAALRLARFNTNIGTVDKRFFQGLPSPAAAGVIAGLVWAMEAYDIPRRDLPWLAWGLTLFAGFTMVSSIKFYSGKDVNFRKSVPFWVVVLIAFGVVALVQIADNLPEVLFSLFLIYAGSGYVMWVLQTFRRKGPQPPPPPRKEPGSPQS